jgi:hypothetical protein
VAATADATKRQPQRAADQPDADDGDVFQTVLPTA